jgi:hypothetical protein
MSQPPYPGPPPGEQPSSGQPYPGQPPYQGEPQPGQYQSSQPDPSQYPPGQYPPSQYPAGQPQPGQYPPGQPQPGQYPPGQPQPGQYPPGQPQPGQYPPDQYQPGQAYPGSAYPAPPGSGQPYQAQPPYPGQPNPDVPTSVPPGYPPTQAYSSAPDYTQPYGQPGYPATGYPPPVPPKKSRTLPIVLTAVAIVLVLCVGGGTAVALVLHNQSGKKNAASPTAYPTDPTTTGPTDEPSTDPSTAAPTAKVDLVEPKTLDGLPKLSYKQFDNTVKLLKTIMSSYPGASGTVGAVYGRVGTKNALLMTATEAKVTDPEFTVDSVLASGGSSTKVSGIKPVPTGSLGGTAKCGNATSAGQKIAICSWADEGSIGIVFFYFKTTSQIKDDFPKVRAQLEKKS